MYSPYSYIIVVHKTKNGKAGQVIVFCYNVNMRASQPSRQTHYQYVAGRTIALTACHHGVRGGVLRAAHGRAPTAQHTPRGALARAAGRRAAVTCRLTQRKHENKKNKTEKRRT